MLGWLSRQLLPIVNNKCSVKLIDIKRGTDGDLFDQNTGRLINLFWPVVKIEQVLDPLNTSIRVNDQYINGFVSWEYPIGHSFEIDLSGWSKKDYL